MNVYVRDNNKKSASGENSETLEHSMQSLNVKAQPNPSKGHFTVLLQSNNPESLQLKVMDAMGRVIETRQGIAANGSISIGHLYRPGVYYAELMQGSSV